MRDFSAKIKKLLVEVDNDTIGDAFITEDNIELKNKLGTIFGVLELINIPDSVVDKIFDIITDLKTEYYLPPYEIEYGIEKRFEECLQRANRRIYKMTQENPARIELENINVLIGLLYRDRVYFSRAGKINSYLFHYKNKHNHIIIDIFASAGEKKPKINSEKLFSNIVSGAITEKDEVFVGNDTILEFLSPNQLMEIISENKASQAIKEIENNLTIQTAINNFYAIFIQPEIEIEEEKKNTNKKLIREKIDHHEPSQKSIDKLIHTQDKTEQYLTPSSMPGWKKILMLIWENIINGSKIIWKYTSKNSIIIWQKSQSLIAEKLLKKDISTKTENPEILDKNETENKEKEIVSKKTKEAVANASKKTIDFSVYKKLLPLSRQNQGYFKILSAWLNKQIAKFVNLNKLQQTLLIISFVIIFFFAQSIVWQGQSGSISKSINIQEIINQAEEKINTAEAQNIFNDEEAARNSISQAVLLMEQIPDKNKYKDDREKLQKRIDDINIALQKIAYIENPQTIANLTNQNDNADTVSISKSNGIIFAYDNNNQNLYKIDLINAQTNSFQLNKEVGNVKKIIALNDNNILILSGDNNFYNFDTTNSLTEKALTTNTKIKDFDIYGDKLYTLRPEDSQIYKHFPSGNTYNSGSAWIKNNSDIKNASIIAIDGGIYVIKTNSQTDYFLGGDKKDTIEIPLDPAITSPTQAYSNIESNYLFILDAPNKRIVIFDKKGNLKTQYTSKEFGDIKSMAVEESDKKIYLLSDNKIYLIEIDF